MARHILSSISCSYLRASDPGVGKVCFEALKKLIQVLINLLLLKTIIRIRMRQMEDGENCVICVVNCTSHNILFG